MSLRKNLVHLRHLPQALRFDDQSVVEGGITFLRDLLVVYREALGWGDRSLERQVCLSELTLWYSQPGELRPYIAMRYGLSYWSDPEFRPQSGWNIIDAGANIGVFSLLCAKRMKYGRILSVEPNPEVFPYLVKNLSVNRSSGGIAEVVPVHAALSDHSGTVSIIVPNSTTEVSIAGIPKSKTVSGRTEEVPAVTLDSLREMYNMDQIDLLKVDIEGAELQVLRSLSKNTLQYVHRLVLEWHSFSIRDEITRLLIDYGFYVKKSWTYDRNREEGIAYFLQGFQ